MKQYKLATNQFSEYRTSVHWEALEKRRDLSAPSCASCHGNHGATPPQVSSVAAVCGGCHALMEDLYNNSPHRPAFSSMGLAGCVTCHSNHAVHKPSEAMLAGADSVCSQCHEADSAGGKAASEMNQLILRLQSELKLSDQVLNLARLSGMEVSEPLLHLQEGREKLVKARVAVHNFRTEAVAKAVNEGLAITADTFRSGQSALKERDFRRLGLAVSLSAILVTMAGLWMAIRRIESRSH